MMTQSDLVRTPDQRLRVFVSSTLEELAAERQAVRDAVTRLRLVPVMFELSARPHPPRQVYRSYLAQSQVFVGVYWQSYGWVGPGEQVSGLEDEYLLSEGLPRLIYVKSPAPDREARLTEMLARIRDDAGISYQRFATTAELQRLVEDDLAVLLSERFEMAEPRDVLAEHEATPDSWLPVPTTSIVGRDQEAAAVADLVLGEGVRLVTLTGPGGVGKSRLAVEAARRLLPSFGDGVRFLELASVPAAELVPAAIAAGLGLSTAGDRLISDVRGYLRARRLLLVLDNFEQVSEAAPVARYASVGLFVERARAARAGFTLTSENAAAVAEICRRLDGLPLAIELAAAKVRLLPPQELLARLDDKMRLLTGGARDLPARQQTLRNTLDWSFGLLSASEQELFARLGVFAGTFDLEAVEAVCDGVGASAGQAGPAAATLGSLVDSSLVRPEVRNGEARFGLLETIREYSLECLRQGADWQDAHDRHAAYFLALAEPAAAELKGSGQLAWLDRLEAEHGNLAAGASWWVDQDRVDLTVRLIWLTWRFWWLRGHVEELAPYGPEILARSERLAPHQRGMALSGTGFMLNGRGEQAAARSLFEQSLPLLRQAGDEPGTAVTAAGLGHIYALEHEYGRASELLEDSLALMRKLGNCAHAALVYNFLGQVQLSQGDDDRAAGLFAAGLAAARRAQDGISLLISLYDLALTDQGRGDLGEAQARLHEGLALCGQAGDETSAAYYLERLAAVAGLQEKPERAVRLIAAALALRQAKGSGWLHAYVPRAAAADGIPAWRSRMGEAAYEQARAWGESASAGRSMAYALEEYAPEEAPPGGGA
jgi:predicted ATPase